jgi:6-pyruvoyltetrahydropterin/6-carboxytetrahydropterin synthase
MPYRICKCFELESGHLLSKHPGKCRFPHGHSRRVEIVLTADQLDANDMVCDFKAVKLALGPFLDSWDHALAINTDDPHFSFYEEKHGARVIPFVHTDPTSEVMAKTIFDEFRRCLAAAARTGDFAIPAAVKVERVRVTETSSSWAEYSA